MGDLMAGRAAWLAAQRHAHMTETVTYRRGGDAVELAASRGHSDFEVADDYGIAIQVQTADFLVLADDLVLAGQAALPQASDCIEADDATFEVRAPGGQAAWRYTGPHRHTLRIHTQEIERP